MNAENYFMEYIFINSKFQFLETKLEYCFGLYHDILHLSHDFFVAAGLHFFSRRLGNLFLRPA
jgi:hypothetical protein